MTDKELFEQFYTQVGVELTPRKCYHELWCDSCKDSYDTIEVYGYSVNVSFGVVNTLFDLDGNFVDQCVFHVDEFGSLIGDDDE